MKTSVHRSRAKDHQANLKEVIMKGKLVLIAMCLVFVSFGTSWADYFLVDQQNMGNIDGWYNLSFYKIDQSFTPSLSTMSEVRIALHNPSADKIATVRVNIRDGSIKGTVDCSINGTVVGSSEIQLDPNFTGMAQFTFRRPLHINPGSSCYFIDLDLRDGTADVAISFEGGGYSQGLLYIEDINYSTDNSDMVFQTGVMERLVGGGRHN